MLDSGCWAITGKEGFRQCSAEHRIIDIFPAFSNEDKLPPMMAESLRTAFESGSRSSVFPKGSIQKKRPKLKRHSSLKHRERIHSVMYNCVVHHNSCRDTGTGV